MTWWQWGLLIGYVSYVILFVAFLVAFERRNPVPSLYRKGWRLWFLIGFNVLCALSGPIAWLIVIGKMFGDWTAREKQKRERQAELDRLAEERVQRMRASLHN